MVAWTPPTSSGSTQPCFTWPTPGRGLASNAAACSVPRRHEGRGLAAPAKQLRLFFTSGSRLRAAVGLPRHLDRSPDRPDPVARVPGRFTPDVALLQLVVTALDLACPPGAEPLEYEGLRERYLPEARFRGRVEHCNSQYALYAAACIRGGLQPDVLSDAGWWQPRFGSTRSSPS
jgi:hypothetical protein